jgi:hypothetical protein
MDTHTLDEPLGARRRTRRRALLAILLSSSLATLGAGAMSLAVFTDSEAATGSWSTGTIILGVDPAAVFSAGDVFPGDTGSQTVTVENNGTGQLRYDLAAAAVVDADGLAGEFDLDIDAGACGSTTGNLYTGSLLGTALSDRVVDAGDDEALCFTWSLPLSTPNAFQDTAAEVEFTFDAEQTANNP